MMNEQTGLLSKSTDAGNASRRVGPSIGIWTVVGSFVAGVVLAVAGMTTLAPSPESLTIPLLGKKHHHHHHKKEEAPPLHFFPKANPDFVSKLPLMEDRTNSFLDDLQTSLDETKPITSGFYRQEAGEELVYEYTYHEMKFIVAGEFHIHDNQGNSVVATAGDVFYFPKGSVITFSSPSFGLGFFVGQRAHGEA